MRFRELLIILLLSSLLAACMSDDDSDDPTATTATSPTSAAATSPTAAESTATTSPTSAPTTPASPEATTTSAPATPTSAAGTPVVDPTMPDTPVGERFGWVLAHLNEGASGMTVEMVEESFTSEVLAQLPADQLLAAIQQFAALGPFTFNGFWEPPTATEAYGLIATPTGGEFLMIVVVEDAEPYRMTGLNFQPAPTPIAIASWDELDSQLTALATDASVLVAEITNDTCTPIHALNADAPLAIGSAFKLYVLGELARKIETGQASWDNELQINEAWKSLPSGVMQDEEAGTPFTLQHYAEMMISISDNTATDHLLHALGRENVEAIQAEMGHAAPERNQPMLTTREMFALKLVLPPDRLDAFIAGTVDERRAILADEVAAAEFTPETGADWTSPRNIDTVEWFASNEDLCRAMQWLHAAGQRPGLEPVLDILSLNPGIPIDDATWSWVGFKGGSEPGVINVTWLLEHTSGQLFAVSATLNDQTKLVDEPTFIRLMMGAIDWLARDLGRRIPDSGLGIRGS